MLLCIERACCVSRHAASSLPLLTCRGVCLAGVQLAMQRLCRAKQLLKN